MTSLLNLIYIVQGMGGTVPGLRPGHPLTHNVDASYYSQGVVLMGDARTEDKDLLLAIHEALETPPGQP